MSSSSMVVAELSIEIILLWAVEALTTIGTVKTNDSTIVKSVFFLIS